MGAFVTFVNNTPDPWHCNINSTVPQVTWQQIYMPVLTAVSIDHKIDPALITAGTGTSFSVYNVPKLMMGASEALVDPELVTPNGGTTAEICGAVAKNIVKVLHAKGYFAIKANQRVKSGQLLLNTEQQVDCKRITSGPTSVMIETIRVGGVKTNGKDSTTSYTMKRMVNLNAPKVENIDMLTDQKKRVLEEKEAKDVGDED